MKRTGMMYRVALFSLLLAAVVGCSGLVFGLDYVTGRTMSAGLISFFTGIDLGPGLGFSLIISIWLGLALTVLLVVFLFALENDMPFAGLFAGLILGIVSLIPVISLTFLFLCTGRIFLAKELFFLTKAPPLPTGNPKPLFKRPERRE